MNQEENNARNIYQDFTNEDLNDLLNFGANTLSYDQRDDIERELKNRQANKNNDNIYQVTKEKQKLLKREFNGFSSLMFLSIMTGVLGMSIFMYILLMIGA